MISNSGSDERGKYSGGQAGDQTGKEWEIRAWYNRPWSCVLRHPNPEVGKMLSNLSIKAAKNNNIGYNQLKRSTYWLELVAAGYAPDKITKKCDADCSAGVIANTKAAGHLLGLPKLQNITATYTGNMRAAYKNAGFEVLTTAKYLTGEANLQLGDILLNDQHHTAVYVGDGALANITKTAKNTSIVKGDKVKIKNGALDMNTGKKYASYVYQTTYEVMSVKDGYVVFGTRGIATGKTLQSNCIAQ